VGDISVFSEPLINPNFSKRKRRVIALLLPLVLLFYVLLITSQTFQLRFLDKHHIRFFIDNLSIKRQKNLPAPEPLSEQIASLFKAL
jgi:hypothetical protein